MYMIGKIIILNIMKRGKQQIFKYVYIYAFTNAI